MQADCVFVDRIPHDLMDYITSQWGRRWATFLHLPAYHHPTHLHTTPHHTLPPATHTFLHHTHLPHTTHHTTTCPAQTCPTLQVPCPHPLPRTPPLPCNTTTHTCVEFGRLGDARPPACSSMLSRGSAPSSPACFIPSLITLYFHHAHMHALASFLPHHLAFFCHATPHATTTFYFPFSSASANTHALLHTFLTSCQYIPAYFTITHPTCCLPATYHTTHTPPFPFSSYIRFYHHCMHTHYRH